MRRLVILILSISAGAAVTASLAMAAPNADGDHPAPKVDRLFAAFDKPGSPGCSTGMIRNGSFVYKKSFGSANLAARTAPSHQTEASKTRRRAATFSATRAIRGNAVIH